jgi:hypothetical protein
MASPHCASACSPRSATLARCDPIVFARVFAAAFETPSWRQRGLPDGGSLEQIARLR